VDNGCRKRIISIEAQDDDTEYRHRSLKEKYLTILLEKYNNMRL
jgi:hypothetical protein